jgi:hypothetical protein
MSKLARGLQVRLARLVLRLSGFVEARHGWSLAAYVVLFLTVLPRLFPGLSEPIGKSLPLAPELQVKAAQAIEGVSHATTYLFAAATIVFMLLLGVLRRWFDPVPKQPGFDETSRHVDKSVVVQTYRVGEDRLHDLVSLGDEAFAAWGGSAEERATAYGKFIRANPRVFNLVKRKDSADEQGFSCVLPLTGEAFRRFRLGIQDSWDFSPADLLPERLLPADYLCLNSIYLRRSIANEPRARAVGLLSGHIADFLRQGDGAMRRPLLVAEGLTRQGRKFLQQYGFTSVYLSRDRLPLYELDLARPEILNDRGAVFLKFLEIAFKEQAEADGTTPQG